MIVTIHPAKAGFLAGLRWRFVVVCRVTLRLGAAIVSIGKSKFNCPSLARVPEPASAFLEVV